MRSLPRIRTKHRADGSRKTLESPSGKIRQGPSPASLTARISPVAQRVRTHRVDTASRWATCRTVNMACRSLIRSSLQLGWFFVF